MASIRVLFDTGTKYNQVKVHSGDSANASMRQRTNPLVVRLPPKAEPVAVPRPRKDNFADTLIYGLDKLTARIEDMNEAMVNGSQRRSKRPAQNTGPKVASQAEKWRATFEADLVEEIKFRKDNKLV
ncbi:hypothetical protein SCUCBS95973_005962 [Sporothrix curviconia]|uniref:Uncharacterized protein n=1 Tax=Sporothrix curviconia TaxID=1260050 RepID=A0ABP0C1K9_9PEZI